jgi:hypothetical protein
MHFDGRTQMVVKMVVRPIAKLSETLIRSRLVLVVDPAMPSLTPYSYTSARSRRQHCVNALGHVYWCTATLPCTCRLGLAGGLSWGRRRCRWQTIPPRVAVPRSRGPRLRWT